MAEAAEVREVTDEAGAHALWPLMRELRPHLADAEELARRWRLQQAHGYRLHGLWSGGEARALAGWRVTDNLVHGRFLYVDDLVTREGERGQGHGAALMDWLKAQGKALGCGKLVLDTPLDNALGQRFYFRQGLLARSLRFNVVLD